ncbi:unnamed protein product, partial [Adineta steineri]
MMNVLFEPSPRLKKKALFTACTLLNIQDGKVRMSIINATNRQQTLSEGTKMGMVTQLATSVNFIIPQDHSVQRIPKGKACMELIPQGKRANTNDGIDFISAINTSSCQKNQQQCRECQQYFQTGNELFKHLRDTCYPDEIRKQIENLVAHIKDDTQQEQLKHILWKYGKLFDTSQPSKIDIVLKNAIDTGTHRPVHTPPYRKSTKDQVVLTNETQKLLKNDLIEHSTSPWSSPVVLVKKKDGTTRFCVDY